MWEYEKKLVCFPFAIPFFDLIFRGISLLLGFYFSVGFVVVPLARFIIGFRRL